VRRAVPAIRQVDPEAKVVVGEVTPLYGPGAWEYLADILRSDVMPLVDGVSWHVGSASPEHMAKHYYAIPALAREITEIASANGFRGKYVASEQHFRSAVTLHPNEYSDYGLTAATKYTMRGIVKFLGMEDFITGLALENDTFSPLVVSWIQNLSTVMAGAVPVELPLEIQTDAARLSKCSFSLPNDDKLLALWTDGVALEFDPGVKASIAFPGLSAREVSAVDVLNGFEQQMINGAEDGKLVIRGLLVKDYPLILRLTDVESLSMPQ